MNFQEAIFAVYVLSTIVGFYLFKPKKITVAPVAKPTPFYSHTDLMEALDRRIMDELTDVQQEYLLKEISMVYDFKQETIDITTRIFSSLSPNMLTQLEQFYTQEYIITYIGRVAKSYLMEYTRKHKMKTK